MPNIAIALKDEIRRLARKELRADAAELKRTASACRLEIAALKRRVAELEKALTAFQRQVNREKPKVAAAPPGDEPEAGPLRFRAAGMASNRKRLGLSAADFGLLVGATGQSIYAWEQGRAKPRAKNLAALAALRGLGKRDVAMKLEELKKTP